MRFYQMTPPQAAENLQTDLASGLCDEQLPEKRRQYGKNELKAVKKEPLFRRFLAQFKDVMILILLFAAGLSALTSVFRRDYTELADAFVIVGIVLLSGVFGLLQEGKAQRTLDALHEMATPQARVLRNGHVSTIDASELLPGDIIYLEAGDRVPADGVLFESFSLKTDETALTGEGLPADKRVCVIEGDNHSVADMENTVFAGTLVVGGRGSAVVTETGMNTQLGKIAGMLEKKRRDKTPLQVQMAQMGKVIGLLALAICVLIFLLGLIERKNLLDMFLTAVSLAVAAIPEGLSATVTVLLALGVQRMAKQRVLIRKLSTVETLAGTGVICTDKTGTLTQNRMTVTECFVNDEILPFTPSNYKKTTGLILYGSLCNDANVYTEAGRLVYVGDPTEGAIIAALEHYGKHRDELEAAYPKLGEIPFDGMRKRKTTVHVIEGENVVVVKGAPDTVFDKCTNQAFAERARAAAAEMAGRALRVLAVAVRTVDSIPPQLIESDIEKDLTLIGLIGMRDLPREEALAAVETCISAGIRPIMITGDHVITAKAIAEEFQIYRPGDLAVSGDELAQIPQDEFERNIEKYSVFARVTPEQKIRIVKAWQKKDKLVAVTGDGMDDAPALQAADIGCAMGKGGTDIAKEAADLVLLDDNFATVVSAVREGRGIYNNIGKTVRFLLSGNIGEIMTIFMAMLLAFSIPLLPLQLLWINVVIAAFPALALGMEPAREGLMTHPPRRKKEGLISRSLAIDIAWQGALIGAAALFAFCIGTGFLPRTDETGALMTGQTMAFAVLSLSQIIHAYDVRSKHSLLSIGIFGNKTLNIACVFSLITALFVMLVPGVNTVFGMCALSVGQWLSVLALSILPFVVCEIVKKIRK